MVSKKNSNLHTAKREKNDEFYTQYYDIEKEIQAYLDYNHDVFKGKTVLLPCDDPDWSNFTKYFAQRFTELGLKKLISTSFAHSARSERDDKHYQKGKIYTLTQDLNQDGMVDINDLEWRYLEGDGDFRSDEITALRDEADMIITNPPFSLFREFIDWIMVGNKKFAVIGNMNAITYKNIFPLIKENKLWLGVTSFNNGMYFRVPECFVYADSYKFEKEQNGVKVNRVQGVCWYANIEHGRRHQPLELMTMADNLKFNKGIIKDPNSYQKYDNYDAIENPKTNGIPSDYAGVMGVPISFLDKYCPEQFEIVGIDRYVADNPHYGKRFTSNGKENYARILIKHKNPATAQ